jgi:hypothetical protein
MRVRHVKFAVGVGAGVLLLSLAVACNQAQQPAGQPAAGQPAAQAAQVHGNLAQVMRGILYPSSNVIFFAQSEDPTKVKLEGSDPSTSPNPLSSSYGGWEAVSNAGIALAEAANLLIIPGRMCMNGKPAPIQNADWQMWVKGLRDAGMVAYKAGQSKNMDEVLNAADVMSTACQNCHDKYREVAGGIPARCQ